MNQLVLELKQANEDFEFYPTTPKMFEKDFVERKKPAIEAIKYMQEAKYADFEEIIKMINRI